MTGAPLPPDEPRRLAALRRSGILDTGPEPSFDDLTFLASTVCGTPIAAVTLVDESRQWFKSILGLPVRETARELSFCAHTILGGDVLVVNDTLLDERFAANALVTADPKLRFYAGAPLVDSSGFALGTVCVVDRVPRTLDDAQLESLRCLARQAAKLIDLGRALEHRTTNLRDTLVERQRAAEALREKEAQLGLLLGQMPAILWAVDRDLRITTSLGAALSTIGLAPNQLVGTSLADFRAIPDPADHSLHAHERALAGESVRYERTLVGRVFDVHLQPLVDAQGERAGAIGIGLDVTEKRRAEEDLRASEERYRSVVETAFDGVLTVDEDGAIRFANPAASRMFGYSAPEMIGRPIATLIPGDRVFPESGHGPRRLSWQATDFVGIRKDGTEIPLEISFSETPSGADRTFTGILRDVSERKVADNLRSALYRVAETTSGAEDLTKLFGAIHRIVGKLMAADSFLIALLDPSLRHLSVPYHAGRLQGAAPALTGRSLPELVFDRGTALLVTPEKLAEMVDRGETDPPAAGAEPCDWLGAPLRSGTRTFGVLAVSSAVSSARYRAADKEVLNFVSRHVASVIEKRQAQDALAEWKSRYEAATHASGQVLYDHDFKKDVITWAGDTPRVLGAPASELPVRLAGWIERIHPDDQAIFREDTQRVWRAATPYHFEYRIRREDGGFIHVRDHGSAFADADGEHTRSVGFIIDATERKSLEEQLRHSQKMEAVGRLAGGVAHDFNNVLTAILGYSDLVLAQVEDEDVRQNVEEIRRAGERAASLTSQLLAFSRKQMLAPRVLDMNALVTNLQKMLRRVIGEDIHLETRLGANLGHVKADPGQLEHVIMNVAVNARDAMPRGGRLTIETSNAVLEEPERPADARLGRPHVLLAVTDTGSGMDEETRARLFEPFFTTKEQGKGTGLGLATSYGIVKQSGGEIVVDSAPRSGTTIRIYLPRVDEPVERMRTGPFPALRLGGSETVLVVEDEKAVGSLARKVLEQSGYRVLEARGGAEAIYASRAHDGPLHLLLTDVVMPGVSGRELAQRLRESRPELRVVYMSGYTDDAIVRHGLQEKDTYFLQKPFSLELLLARVREALEGRPPAG